MAVHNPTVQDLLGSPALQLRLLAGEAGLSRSVSWAHVSELEDPTPWLLGAEVIMTIGLAVPRDAQRQRRYLERLDDAGVAALAITTRLKTPPLHDAFFAAAEERGLPVLEVPLNVPFITISQEVAAALGADAGQRAGAQLQVFGALRWLAEEDLEPRTLFRRLERLSGYRVFLCTPQGRPLLPGVDAPPDTGVLPTDPDAPPSIPGGFVLPVPAPGGPAGYLVAYERRDARPAGLVVVQHLATVAALRLAMVRHERETRRREGAETLAELLQDALDAPTAARRLARRGLEGDIAVTIVRNVPYEALIGALDDHPHLMLRRGEDRYVLSAPSAAPAIAALPGVVAGMSRPFTPGEPTRVAQREAAWAVARAAESGDPLVHYGDDTTGRWLPDDPQALTALVDHVLGPVIAYDTEHRSHLVASVRTWLERDRRTDRAAAALHVHPNTLTYRLHRFTDLTGRDLTSTAALTEVWLAIQAARRLGVT